MLKRTRLEYVARALRPAEEEPTSASHSTISAPTFSVRRPGHYPVDIKDRPAVAVQASRTNRQHRKGHVPTRRRPVSGHRRRRHRDTGNKASCCRPQAASSDRDTCSRRHCLRIRRARFCASRPSFAKATSPKAIRRIRACFLGVLVEGRARRTRTHSIRQSMVMLASLMIFAGSPTAHPAVCIPPRCSAGTRP